MKIARAAGFTLIEVIIAIALGAVICATAMGGARILVQAATVTNRLALQNDLLRNAVIRANDELDSWQAFDRPDDPTAQPLRAPGMPFAPMSFADPLLALDFDQKGARIWWNGPLWTSNDQRFGDYSRFGRRGGSDLDETWRHTLLPALTSNLGYYAAVDYFPANWVYAWYDENGVVPSEFSQQGAGPGRFRTQWHHSVGRPLTKLEAGHDSGFLISHVPAPTLHPACHHAAYVKNSGAWDTANLGWGAAPAIGVLPLTPSGWPRVDVRVLHQYHWLGFNDLARITLRDPVDGKSTVIEFALTATTLRGARRQRRLDLP